MARKAYCRLCMPSFSLFSDGLLEKGEDPHPHSLLELVITTPFSPHPLSLIALAQPLTSVFLNCLLHLATVSTPRAFHAVWRLSLFSRRLPPGLRGESIFEFLSCRGPSTRCAPTHPHTDTPTIR